MTDPNAARPFPIDRRLRVPQAPARAYKRNFVAQMAVQLRFPALVEMDMDELKRAAKALRKRFPFFERMNELKVGPSGASQDVVHQLRTRDNSVRIAITTSAISIETGQYQSYELIRKDVEAVAAATAKLIDSTFFTHVGLRYVNRIPIPGDLDTWINPLLNAAVRSGALGVVRLNMTEVRGMPKSGGAYVLRYGFTPSPDGQFYTLDLDFSDSGLDVPSALPRLDALRTEANNLFEWCIADGTREAMLSSTVSAQSS